MNVMDLLAKTGEGALTEAMGLVPGAATINAALVEAQRQRHQRLGDEFLQHVALLLADRARSQIGTLVIDRLHQEAAADAVNRGLRSIFDAIDPQARICVAVLVTEYLYRVRAPDRIYRRAANLFADVTSEDLLALSAVANNVVAMMRRPPTNRTVTLERMHTGLEGRVWARSAEDNYDRESFPMPAAFMSAVQALLRHGFARSDQVAGSLVGGDPVARFDPGDAEALEILQTCLSALLNAR